MVDVYIRKIALFVFLFTLSCMIASAQFSNVTFNSSLIAAVLVNPKFGASQVDRFELTINVSNTSTCRYSYNPLLNYSEIISPVNQFSTANGKTHKIVDFLLQLPEGETKTMYVLCQTPLGYVNNGFPINITLGVDKTEPHILSAQANPVYLIEAPKTNITVKTDDESICRFDRFSPTQEEFISFFNNANITKFSKSNSVVLIPPNIEDNKDYSVAITCMNRAKMISNDIRIVTFSVNLSAQNKIVNLLPTGYIKGSEAEILIETNRDSTCSYTLLNSNSAGIFPQEHDKIHFIQKINLEDKKLYNFNIRCEFDQGIPSLIDSPLSFMVDRTLPKNVTIQTETQTCNKFLSANFFTNDSDIFGFYYRILDSKNVVIKPLSFVSAQKVTLENLSLIIGEKYFWEFFATDNAGNNGTVQKSSGTQILASDDSSCAPNKPPVLSKTIKITETGISIALLCKDDDGCKDMNYLMIDSKNSLCSCDSCNYTRYDLPLFGIKENSTVCYKTSDNKNATISGFFSVAYVSCLNNEAECCSGKRALYCEGNCTPVTEKECDESKTDTDLDTILDSIEVKCGLDINNPSDAQADFDSDGLTNKDECMSYNTNISKADSDDDSYTDKEEIEKNTSPNNKNEVPKDQKKDTDTDGIPDYKEKECGLDPETNDAGGDNDKDGLTNKEECLEYRTNMEEADSDGDKVSDKVEIDKETDPNDNSSYPKSNFLSILLIFVAIGALGGGAFFILKNKNSLSGLKSKMPQILSQNKAAKNNQMNQAIPQKIGVDFRQAKKDLHNESKLLPKNPVDESDLDYQIRKKKEWLRLRQMSSIFDEFGKDAQDKKNLVKSEDLISKINRERIRERDSVFERLDDISKGNAFEQIEAIKKKSKLSKEEEDKLDRLGSKRK